MRPVPVMATRRRGSVRPRSRPRASARCGAQLCLAIAALALTCSDPVQGEVLGAHATSPSLAAEAVHHAGKTKRRCPSGHVLLALTGPRLITAQRPEAYVVLVRTCG